MSSSRPGVPPMERGRNETRNGRADCLTLGERILVAQGGSICGLTGLFRAAYHARGSEMSGVGGVSQNGGELHASVFESTPFQGLAHAGHGARSVDMSWTSMTCP
jgi:hypothetical protein